jgi:hypothetical protein
MSSALESTIGLILLIVTTLSLLLLSFRQRRSGKSPAFRHIPAISKFKRAVGMSVEDGTRIHVSLGNASLTQPLSSSAFISLKTLKQIGELSSNSDNPPVATSGDGALALLSQDTLHDVARQTHTLDLFKSENGSLAGITPLTNVAGALQIIADRDVKTNVLIGNYGSEAGYLSTASQEKGALTIAASDSLTAQSVFFATVEQPLIGEELFAVPAYLHDEPMQNASLQMQDLLRGLIVLTLLVGAILKLVGVL